MYAYVSGSVCYNMEPSITLHFLLFTEPNDESGANIDASVSQCIVLVS